MIKTIVRILYEGKKNRTNKQQKLKNFWKVKLTHTFKLQKQLQQTIFIYYNNDAG